MEGLLMLIGTFALLMCITVVLLGPLALAFIISPVYLWIYVIYVVLFFLFIAISTVMVGTEGDEDRELHGEEEDNDE